MDVSNLKYYVRRDENGDIFEKVAVSSIVKVTPKGMGDRYFVNNAQLMGTSQIEDSLLNQDADVTVVLQWYEATFNAKVPRVQFYPVFGDSGLIGKRKITSISKVNDLHAVILNNEQMYSIKVLDMDLSSVSEV